MVHGRVEALEPGLGEAEQVHLDDAVDLLQAGPVRADLAEEGEQQPQKQPFFEDAVFALGRRRLLLHPGEPLARHVLELPDQVVPGLAGVVQGGVGAVLAEGVEQLVEGHRDGVLDQVALVLEHHERHFHELVSQPF